jgi:hypothetical protein
VDAASALADLTEISSHVEAAAIVDDEGTLLAVTPGGDRLAEAGFELLREADARFGRTPAQLEVVLRQGSVFVHREADRIAVARTRPHAPSALVFHDLAAALADA